MTCPVYRYFIDIRDSTQGVAMTVHEHSAAAHSVSLVRAYQTSSALADRTLASPATRKWWDRHAMPDSHGDQHVSHMHYHPATMYGGVSLISAI